MSISEDDRILLWIGGVALCFAILAFLNYKTEADSPKCAIGHYETRNGMIMAGNVLVPTTYQDYVCDVYETKKL